MNDRDIIAALEAWAEERPRTGSKQLHSEAAQAAGRAFCNEPQQVSLLPNLDLDLVSRLTTEVSNRLHQLTRCIRQVIHLRYGAQIGLLPNTTR